MASLKKTLVARGMRLMSDPRVMKLMQDPRVMKALMSAMSMPARAQNFAKEHAETVARAMALATEDELKDLRRTVRRLENELEEMKGEKAPAGKKKSRAAE
jgi:hypothetical protein